MTNLKDVEQASYTAPIVVSDEMVQDMPERIYASIPSSKGCVVSFDIPSLAYDTEYVRADVVAALSSAPCSEAVRQQADYQGFALEVCRIAFDGCDASGYDIQDIGVKHGVLTKEAYNPEVHTDMSGSGDYEVGDTIYIFVPSILALQTTQPEPAVKVDAWQPIKTAPKDGEKVDLWCGHVLHGSTRAADARFYGKWFIGDLQEPLNQDWTPTHWMPLPAAPLNRIGGAE